MRVVVGQPVSNCTSESFRPGVRSLGPPGRVGAPWGVQCKPQGGAVTLLKGLSSSLPVPQPSGHPPRPCSSRSGSLTPPGLCPDPLLVAQSVHSVLRPSSPVPSSLDGHSSSQTLGRFLSDTPSPALIPGPLPRHLRSAPGRPGTHFPSLLGLTQPFLLQSFRLCRPASRSLRRGLWGSPQCTGALWGTEPAGEELSPRPSALLSLAGPRCGQIQTRGELCRLGVLG